MKSEFYLVIAAKCYSDSRFDDPSMNLEMRGTPRCNKNKPSLNAREIALKFNIDLPNSLFRKPMLTINTTISEAAKGDDQIIAQIQETIADKLKDVQGVTVSIQAPEVLL